MSNKHFIDITTKGKTYLNFLKSNNVSKPLLRSSSNTFDAKSYTTSTGNDDFAFKQKILQEYVNKKLESFGHNNRIDNIVYGTSKAGEMFKDMNQYYLFPLGNFSYTFVEDSDFNSRKNPINKVYASLIQVVSEFNNDKAFHDIWLRYVDTLDFSEFKDKLLSLSKSEYIGEDIDAFLIVLKGYDEYLQSKVHTDTNIKLAINNGHEIWIQCDQFIMLSEDYYNDLRPAFKSLGYNLE